MASFSAFNFTNIAGYPNQMLKFKDIGEFPVFSMSEINSATDHWDGMERCFILTNTSHLDVKFKAFASYLTHDASEMVQISTCWYYSYYDDLKKKFFDRWQEKKDPVLLNNAQMTIKRSENESIEEFDRMFDIIIK